jgi:predicted  nucleic acid-binding Zn-ribbon protein
LKKHLQTQQDLKLNQQRIYTLEKKCSSLNTEEMILKDTERELKREVDSLQEYKSNLSKEREALLKE